jgi:AraC-like DNA-binding protein
MAVGKRNHEATHRLAWALANKAVPPLGMHVMHSCDRPACVNPAHLTVGTAADNQRDCSRKGRKNVPKGSRHKSAKTTEGQMIRAAHLFAAGMTYRRISQRLGISRWSLMKAFQGHRWPHLQGVLNAILRSGKQMEAA